MLVLNHTFLNFFLDYEKTEEEASEEPGEEEVYYQKLDLSRGIEGEDYGIVFGAVNEDVYGEA
jgi:hypothetical protein